ncbi:hypothetical protein CAQU_05680 [Corynebacterium aquilae DSM 44791]|uniref:DUF3515 domain-containing protein n=1 Tax=Corynebacterium aquilae DSM 44791 TaxID=1431546 RepID=A0A1L7CFK4_9CORY|nr:hypothetical protein CAQU_05680 [Corynebacterium aquilae DSM 44791]
MESFSAVSRTPMLIALGLAIALTVGVLVGAKVVYERAAHQPVSLSPVAAPDASSVQCAEFLDRLPKKVMGFERAELADPAPEGAAVFAADSQRQVSVRCGVSVPAQFSVLSHTRDVDGVEWLKVTDDTPGSSLVSWYSVNRAPTVAVTTDVADDPVVDLSEAVAGIAEAHPQPAGVPLGDLPQAADYAAVAAQCSAFAKALPASVGDGYKRLDEAAVRAAGAPEGAVVYTAEGVEPVVVRCGVGFPVEYQPGARLDDVNSVPWLTSAELKNGSTAGVFYGLGFDATVAVSTPRSVGGTAVTSVSDAMVKNLQRSQVQPQ